jgi:hypothetical protein
MLRLILHKWILIFALSSFAALLDFPTAAAFQAPPPKGPMGWQSGDRKWPDWLEETTKRLEKSRKNSQPGPEIEFLHARASELLERARQSRDNYFRFDRYIAATNSLLEAADRLVWVRKVERIPQEQDYWGIGMILQGYAFRVRQADFFASLIPEKNTDQYVTWSKSFYQQARSAYDAHEYQRARLFGDASSFIVFALECIAQATVQMSDAPIPK